VIFFDIRLNNQPTSTVCIRQVSAHHPPGVVLKESYAYEVVTTAKKVKRRGTVTHSGPEDFKLIAAVLNDYVSNHGG
jgi:hypothetical protein